ncbi:MAG: IS66 family insertion sequence element accessory protein TnpB [Spirochaetales bacterium]|jgi:transposase|nr:IS66 family insertion sequence element accessory protein TnpB [Spirochaetales bacterium]
MIIDLEQVDIYVRPGKTDMRKQINGLSVIVQEELKLDPFSGALFLFCNKRRHLLKILYWDKTGFALWLKRLEKDRFFWPMDRTEVQEIDFEQLRQLLSGINFWEVHEEVKYSSVC